MKILRYYQVEAVEKICSFFNSDKYKAKIYLSTGLGKNAIIVSVLETILRSRSNTSLAILATTRAICYQIKSALFEMDVDINIAFHIRELYEQKVLITTYQDVIQNQSRRKAFDLVICDEAQYVKSEDNLETLIGKRTKLLGLLQNLESFGDWFDDAECLYSYTTKDALRDGYSSSITEEEFIQRFLIKLLNYQGYINIVREVKISSQNKKDIRPDIIAEKKNKVVIEVKAYRNLHNSKAILNNALKQILQYRQIMLHNNKTEEFSFIIVMPCEIDDESQKEIYEKYNITIWDINNLIYLCEGSKELLNLLASCIPYPLFEIKATKPFNVENKLNDIIIDVKDISLAEMYQNKLENCKPGKYAKADKKYEAICTEIIKYLFETEFFRVSEQHKTEDEMFRMDLLCSLKGTSEFWKFLITFYHTKFVVFEYKNYSDYISQNLIYITEKYLFPAVLRNVAFIISRKGFDPNAEKAALGCLKESGKLIISLEDNDLIKMIYMKENGEEPSDYLLNKVEQILMSVSK